MKTLLIDDMRDIDADVVARTYQAGVEALKGQRFDILYLDHDLGCFDENGREWTGYDVLCFLEENPHLLPGKIVIVSSNASGVPRMRQVIDKLYKGEVK